MLPHRTLLSILLLLPSLALALPSLNPINGPYSAHETREHTPSGWVKGPKVAPNRVLPFRVGLKQSRMEELEEIVMAVSDPASPRYGQHYTPDEIRDIFASSEETVGTVTAWLISEGIEPERIKLSKSGTWLEFPVTVEEAERLLKTEYHTYSHLTGSTQVASSDSYYLPEAVREHVEIVMPTLHLDAHARPRKLEMDEQRGVQKRTVTPAADAAQVKNILKYGAGPSLADPQGHSSLFNWKSLQNCSLVITPACLEALYKFSPQLVPSFKQLPLGIVEFSPVYVQFDDLHTFENSYATSRKGYTPNVNLINGATESQTIPAGGIDAIFNKFGEGNLDVQYAVALTNTPVTIYQVGPEDGSGSFNTFLEAIDGSYCTSAGSAEGIAEGDPTTTTCGTFAGTSKVFSTSYGYNEVDLTLGYEIRQCAEYAKLGAMGYSFLFSSGDNGVAGNGDECTLGDNYVDGSTPGSRFNPSFPSTCPLGVTSVGATQMVTGKTVLDKEVVANSYIISGGGVSDRFALPSYQSAAVKGYFQKYKPSYSASQYNTSGNSRAFPDVSANGLNYTVTLNQQQYLVGGTSASAPTFASIINILNNARANIGKGTLGFLNPFLYAHPNAFQDITSGSNPGCTTNGFSAQPGWDPATGLGTPNVPLLLAAALIV